MADTRRLTHLKDSVHLQLPPGPLVVALSGGSDSGALAWLVQQAGHPLTAVHVDHGLTHSPLMREAAARTASHLGIELEIVRTEVSPGPSPEGQAREARYRAFARSSAATASILTAHTADDNLETVLINLIRGTGTRGLAGIPRFRPPNIYRPLLTTTRDQLREIAHLVGIPYADDPMNLEPSLARTRLRTTVIPRLRELNPSILDSVTAMTALVRNDADLLDGVTPTIPAVVDGMVRVPLGTLAAMPDGISDRYLIGVLESLGLGPERERIERIRAVANGEAVSREIAGGVTASRAGPLLVIGREPGELTSAIVLSPGQHRLHGLVFDVIASEAVCRVAPLDRWHAIFPKGTVLEVGADLRVIADGEEAWVPGVKRLPVAWYQPGELGYLSVFAREESGWT